MNVAAFTRQATLDMATVINMLKDINNATQDISARLNVVETKVLEDINNATQDMLNVVETKVLKSINNATQDIGARLNAVETKVSAGGVRNGGGGGVTGGDALAAATSSSAATLEQMRALLHQEGSGSCPLFSSEARHRLCCL